MQVKVNFSLPSWLCLFSVEYALPIIVHTGFRQPKSPSKKPPPPACSLKLSDWLRMAPPSAPPSCSFSTLLENCAGSSLGVGVLPLVWDPSTTGSIDNTLRRTHCVGVSSVSGVHAATSESGRRNGASEIGVLNPEREGEGHCSWTQAMGGHTHLRNPKIWSPWCSHERAETLMFNCKMPGEGNEMVR